MENSAIGGRTTEPKATITVTAGLRLDQIIRSDALADLSEFRKFSPVLQQIIDEPLQVRLVLDANIVQRELRWRLRNRRNKAARSALHEAIDSGTILAFAPTALVKEIDDHISEIAQYAYLTEERAREEWANLQSDIHFYEPEAKAAPGEYGDPNDAPYKHACIELGAHAVYTRDSHFKSMDVPLIMLDLDQVFRSYARANGVALAFKVGSAFTITISVGALKEFLKLFGAGVRRVPPPLKIAFLFGIAATLIHPASRAKIIAACKTLWNKFNDPVFIAALSSLIQQLAEAHEIAKMTSMEIEASLPKSRKRSALMHAREICVIEKEPLTLSAIKVRMQAAGYVTRSRHFANHLRRVLRGSRTFVEASPGMWTLRASTARAA
jgi:predicted nucleic acid-binding protein